MKKHCFLIFCVLFMIACQENQTNTDTVKTEINSPEKKEASTEIDIYANPNSFEHASSLKIGDVAPLLKIEKWYNTAPIDAFEKGKVYVVEFWASWCQPCRKSIPHLNKLQKEFKDELVVVAVAASERKGTTALEKLLATKKEELTYAVGYTNDGQTFKNYMWAANNTGLPWTFIIDKNGKVVWWGQPFYSQFESTLRSVIKGTYMPQEGSVPVYANKEGMKKYWDIQEQFWAAYGDENLDKAIELGKQLYDSKNELFYYESATLFELMLSNEKTKGEALAIGKELEQGLLKQNPEGLSAMAYAIVDKKDPSDEEMQFGVQLVEKANDLTLHENPSINILYGRLLLKNNNPKKALELLKTIKPKIDDEEMVQEVEQIIETI